MKNEQILKKAIEKAVKNGWNCPEGLGYYNSYGLGIRHKEGFVSVMPFELIYLHSFAKALWGEDTMWEAFHPIYGKCKNIAWKFHLQQMVLEKDPIKYLEKYI